VRLVLASRSPRRAELLTLAGYRFAIVPADIDETGHPGECGTELVRRLAREKMQAVSKLVSEGDQVIIGADTAVLDGDRILGKPADKSEAEGMLCRLSGRAHEVVTGVAIEAGGLVLDEVVSTHVVFRELTDRDISWYVATGESFGKAGAYAIQGLASRFVTRIEGSYSNVVGLPISTIDGLLARLVGANPLDDDGGEGND